MTLPPNDFVVVPGFITVKWPAKPKLNLHLENMNPNELATDARREMPVLASAWLGNGQPAVFQSLS